MHHTCKERIFMFIMMSTPKPPAINVHSRSSPSLLSLYKSTSWSCRSVCFRRQPMTKMSYSLWYVFGKNGATSKNAKRQKRVQKRVRTYTKSYCNKYNCVTWTIFDPDWTKQDSEAQPSVMCHELIPNHPLLLFSFEEFEKQISSCWECSLEGILYPQFIFFNAAPLLSRVWTVVSSSRRHISLLVFAL